MMYASPSKLAEMPLYHLTLVCSTVAISGGAFILLLQGGGSAGLVRDLRLRKPSFLHGAGNVGWCMNAFYASGRITGRLMATIIIRSLHGIPLLL